MDTKLSHSELGLTISDLFFNSIEIEKELDFDSIQCNNALVCAENWLNNYPYFKQFINAEGLANDFLNRV